MRAGRLARDARLARSRPTCERARRILVIGAIGVASLSLDHSHAIGQTLTGPTGLVTIPTASRADDAALSLGAALLNRRTLPMSVFDRGVAYPLHGLAYYARIGYLPFLEVTLRVTRFIDRPGSQGIGDRMLAARVILLPEWGILPSVAVGANDLIGTRKFHALYAVSSKHLGGAGLVPRIGLHAGYASDVLEARYHQLSGPFGGLSVSPVRWTTLLIEHDTRRFNAGLRISVGPLGALFAVQDFRFLTGAVRYRFRLLPGD